jgi:hypothetical protein
MSLGKVVNARGSRPQEGGFAIKSTQELPALWRTRVYSILYATHQDVSSGR